MSFEEQAEALMQAEGSDVVAVIVLHWPEDENAMPWADCHGCIPKQDVAAILSALGASLGEATKGQQ